MIREADISDARRVIGILSSYYSEEELEGALLYFMIRVRDKAHFSILLDKDNSVCVFLERVGNFKAQVHIYATELARGSYVSIVSKEIFKYVFNNTKYTSFITFSPSRVTSIFSRRFGFKALGSVEDAGGEGVDEEFLYASKKMIIDKLKLEDK